MSDWLLNQPVLWMTVVILATTYLIATGFYLLVTALATGDRARAFKSISPAMLPPLALVFALLVGFLAAQVWSDADRANGAVNREASALRAVVLLANGLPDSVEARLRELVRHHVQDAVKLEWPAMARGGPSSRRRCRRHCTWRYGSTPPTRARLRPNARLSLPSRVHSRRAVSALSSVDPRSTGSNGRPCLWRPALRLRPSQWCTVTI